MREHILSEIRRVTAANGGNPPGARSFERETDIRQAAWRGVYWARWSDALREAGFERNIKKEKYEEQFFLIKLAEACRHFHRFPTAMELRMYRKATDAEFPNVKSITRHFDSLTSVPTRLAE